MTFGGSIEVGPEVEARALTLALEPLLPLKKAALFCSPRGESTPRDLPGTACLQVAFSLC